jgi:tetratricopeptide (TPR) repeat protein
LFISDSNFLEHTHYVVRSTKDALLASISEAFELAKLGNQAQAAEVLRHEFEKLQSPGRRIDLCEWIADCFEKLQEYTQAGNWYEMAGELILSQVGTSMPAAVVNAFREYERALDCYERGNEAEDVERCDQILGILRRSFASS